MARFLTVRLRPVVTLKSFMYDRTVALAMVVKPIPAHFSGGSFMEKAAKRVLTPDPYQTPTLTTYGKLSELTRGNTGSGMDNGMMKNP